jgi:tRNA(adenine34) deaminase
MCEWTRRSALTVVGGALAGIATPAYAESHRKFVTAAFAMKDKAIAAGDQAYGAVVVRTGVIVGWGPSRVRDFGEWVGHAEREAIRDAQRRLARDDLFDCAMYSTSRPCDRCESAALQAKIARMYYGREATETGRLR